MKKKEEYRCIVKLKCKISYILYRCTTFGDIFVSYSAVLLTGIQSKLYLPDIILDFYMIRVHSSEYNMASPTTNSINNTPKNKVPGSIQHNDHCLEYVNVLFHFILLFFVLFFFLIDMIPRRQILSMEHQQ